MVNVCKRDSVRVGVTFIIGTDSNMGTSSLLLLPMPCNKQGAFYVLSYPLVEHLYRGREHYVTFVNEDVTMGSWLLGV